MSMTLRALILTTIMAAGMTAAPRPSWLHVENSRLVDESGRGVDLTGFNWPGLEFGSGVGGPRIEPGLVQWIEKTFRTNVWRLPLNAVWWNDDVEVPLAGMRYRQWFRQAVEWCKQNGSYVILSHTTQYKFPPCGGDVKYCASQDLGGKALFKGRLDDPEVKKQIPDGAYIEPVARMWDELARLYADDPAILYDVFNEPHDITAEVWKRNMSELIAAVRKRNPKSVIFVGGPNWKNSINPLINGEVPDFSEPNLIYDFHVYSGEKEAVYQGKLCREPGSYVYKNWPINADEQIGWTQKRGKAAAISEWGGRCDFDQYNDAIAAYALKHHVMLVYYCVSPSLYYVEGGEYKLAEVGERVRRAYAMFGK